MVLLRLPSGDSTRQIVLMCAVLVLLGAGLVLTTPPVMAEIALILQELEEKKPGRFGANGAYAQGVCMSCPVHLKNQRWRIVDQLCFYLVTVRII